MANTKCLKNGSLKSLSFPHMDKEQSDMIQLFSVSKLAVCRISEK